MIDVALISDDVKQPGDFMAAHNNRPISPHLQVYKLPLTGIISISHRMTGVLLSVGLLLFVYIVSAIADGGQSYLSMQAVMSLWVVKLLYWGFVYALFFHLSHGMRHLIWDTGRSFERETLNQYAVIELAVSLALTLATFIFI